MLTSDSEVATDHMIRAEKAAATLKGASDALLTAMVLKGLPDQYRAFVSIVTQSETVDTCH